MSELLYVPMKVEALVISEALQENLNTSSDKEKYNWTNEEKNYEGVINSFAKAGPHNLRPKDKNSKTQGVYLHWILPAGLRKSHSPNQYEDLLPLPNQWIITRFARDTDGSTAETIKHWYINSSVEQEGKAGTPLVVDGAKVAEVKYYGKVYDLEDALPSWLTAKKLTTPSLKNALGNAKTASSDFTAFVANNKLTISWQDEAFSGLDQANNPVLSYQVVGWYGDETQDPFQVLKKKGIKTIADILKALKWQLSTNSDINNISNVRCLFHGMTGYIDYLNGATYKGPKLGLPGAGTLKTPSNDGLFVGLGFNAKDALVALATKKGAQPVKDKDEKITPWKGVEVAVYNQLNTLVDANSFREAPREYDVHKNWFRSYSGGQIWEIVEAEKNKNTLSSGQPKILPAVTAVILSKLPIGISLSNKTKGPNFFTATNGKTTLTLALADLVDLSLNPNKVSNPFTIEVALKSAGLGASGSLYVDPKTSALLPPLLICSSACGISGKAIPLFINARLVADDGSETLSKIQLSGIPQGATLSNETQGNKFFTATSPAASTTLTIADLEQLMITVPAKSPNFTLQCTVRSSQISGEKIITNASLFVQLETVADAGETPQPQAPILTIANAFLIPDQSNIPLSIIAEESNTISHLTDMQSTADQTARTYAALQQDLYMLWWQLAHLKRQNFPPIGPNRGKINAVKNRIKQILGTSEDGLIYKYFRKAQKYHAQLITREIQLLSLPHTLSTHMKNASGRALKAKAAPRFYMPHDPVLVLHDTQGKINKHLQKAGDLLSCRTKKATFLSAITDVNIQVDSQNLQSEIKPIANPNTFAQTKFYQSFKTTLGDISAGIETLIREAQVAEASLFVLANKLFADPSVQQKGWSDWLGQMEETMSTGSADHSELNFGAVPVQQIIHLWGQQPWSPLYLDWEVNWGASNTTSWTYAGYDYRPQSGAAPTKDNPWPCYRGRTIISPTSGPGFIKKPFEDALAELKDFIENFSDNSAARLLKEAEIGTNISELQEGILYSLNLHGMNQCLINRDASLPALKPDPKNPWVGATVPAPPKFANWDAAMAPFMKAIKTPGTGWSKEAAGSLLKAPLLSPPSYDLTKSNATLPSILHSGCFSINNVKLIDDFGQWMDLGIGTNSNAVAPFINPHAKSDWTVGELASDVLICMPPRQLQASRLNFRFMSAADPKHQIESHANDPSTSPLLGWVTYNHLDRSIQLLDPAATLLGELSLVPVGTNTYRTVWDALDPTGSKEIDQLPLELKHFISRLVSDSPVEHPLLKEFFGLIDSALANISPSPGHDLLTGRPLALVKAKVGLELFGDFWLDPQSLKPMTSKQKWGVQLGSGINLQDGLLGYFTDDQYQEIFTNYVTTDNAYTKNIAAHLNNATQVGYGDDDAQILRLLIDPHGSIHAGVGILPAKSIHLPASFFEDALQQYEIAIRKRSVLHSKKKVALAHAHAKKGKWNLYGPQYEKIPFEPADTQAQHHHAPSVASDMRLILRQNNETE